MIKKPRVTKIVNHLHLGCLMAEKDEPGRLQLQSLHFAVTGTLITFLGATANAAMKLINTNPSLLVTLVGVSIYGVMYWYGADHDAGWYWGYTKESKNHLTPKDVILSVLLLFSFAAFPVILQQTAPFFDPARAIRQLFECFLVIRFLDFVGRFHHRRNAALFKNNVLREYFGGAKQFIRSGIALVVTSLLVIWIRQIPRMDGQTLLDWNHWRFQVIHGIFAITVLVSEMVIWKWREQARVSLISQPD